ncbi:hypothetical protein [Pseudomonas aeruginosa]|uniref:hypothetical protein n=1 Tax=Pseudomonas aeruginosa TaxID=287 RepID=UPI000EAF053B|nr:hypothetical protein [Pseudomonas aeruginosa]MBG3979423.1 hypothetical protein [Pseudomonas aeruginosa]MBG5696257.1 hypothetical protein [Pseudomonas aeruginosa]MCK1824217.1 hypothetical protein [Pseudomonas aeruginosa]MDI4001571.1 hypothetical protein [Pseudomonas aeruginosa]
MNKFSEDDVHKHLHATGLEAVIVDCPLFDVDEVEPCAEEPDFQLWRIIKSRALAKLERLHGTIRYGTFVGTKIKLPTDHTKPMELDLLGTHEDGLFVLELKIDRSAERNAFSELFAYSNYIAGIFALSGHQDITNVLVANLDNKITKQAFLYDLLINERDIIVYRPSFPGGNLESLQLDLYLPSDDDFRHFTNELLSHDAMSCVVISFHDLDGWFDSEENGGGLNDWTTEHLSGLSGYAAQLMEAERLHGFCFIRKPWREIPCHYRNSLFICALNPFRIAEPNRANSILSQLDESEHESFLETPELAFEGRLIRLAQRTIKDCLTDDYSAEVVTPYWGEIVTDSQEVVFTHNFAFRPTGIMREAYSGFLNERYAREASGQGWGGDISILKINEIHNWLRAWMFMEGCGFKAGETLDDEADGDT